MPRFDPDPNKPGWGTFVNDQGKAVYDYFPNVSPPTQSLSPSASPTPAVAAPGGGAPVPGQGAPQAMTPSAGAPPVAPPATAGSAPGATPRATQLVGVLNAANPPAPRADGLVKTGVSSSTSTQLGRDAGAIARDKATARAGYDSLEAANTQVGEARTARDVEGARTLGAQAASEQQDALNREASAGIERSQVATKLSEKLAEKDPAVDPNRLVKNMGAGQKVLTVILAALSGGFATVAGQKGNPALDVLNAQISADLASQEKEIESGRIQRGNLIQAYREQGMDARQAQAAARATYTDAARRVALAKVQELGAAAHAEDAKLLNAGLEQQYSNLVQQLDASGESRTATQNGVSYERPKPVDAKAGIELAGKKLAARKAYEEAGADAAQLAEFDERNGIETPKGESETARGKREAGEKRNEDQAKASGAWAAIDEYAKSVGVKNDTKTGSFEGDNSVGDYIASPETREGAKSMATLGRSDTPIKNRRLAAQDGVTRLMTGAGLGKSEQEFYSDALAKAGTPSQIADALNAIRTVVAERMSSSDAKSARASSVAPASWKGGGQ